MSETLQPTSTQNSVDPITLEVIRHGLVSITDQIDANITRTAFSPYIYEYKDFAVGLAGPDGELIAQSTGGMPVFVADSVGMAVRDGLAVYGKERLHHGDFVLCNHAAVQGQHLNNTVLYTPIFAGPERKSLAGFFAINMHWIDIGGITPRSTDIFMEGLQLRSIKLWSKGEPIEEVYRIIENNTRFPVELMGDIAAQHAGCVLGRDLVQALADKYGVEVFLKSVQTILDQSEAAARAKIRAMPDGTYSHETFFDNDGESDEPLPIIVKVIVAGDEMTVDLSDMADQVKGCINSGYYGGGRTSARVAFKYLIADEDAANEGTFRPLKLILPRGKTTERQRHRADGQLLPAVSDGHRRVHQSPGAGAAGTRHRRALWHLLRRAFPRPARQRHAVRLPRQRPRRLGWLRHSRRRRPVSHHGPWRYAHHSGGAAGVHVSLSRGRVRPARRTPPAPANSAAAWASAKNISCSATPICKRCSTG